MAQRPLMRDAGAFGRKDWIEAALEILAAEGIEGVRVEVLARTLNITKGSFYHHFRDRDDLHAAMLAQWWRSMVTDIMGELEQILDPLQRFRALMQVPTADSRANFDMELAIRLWARRDERARATLERADALRIEFIARVLAACGVAPDVLRARAVLAFAYLRVGAGLADAATLERCVQTLIAPA